ncbi:hypothetical protein HPP92_019798 [Vanilla planifolia]|uniref:THO1-MOS11 C-terminal domain-containing protein n=1 Tax=Vanilla planifolia TaxID=51239 RepID=A0A835Q187_VANPL|nr:hypothetical protein HPP92_019798 [Vanilla planifolia]
MAKVASSAPPTSASHPSPLLRGEEGAAGGVDLMANNPSDSEISQEGGATATTSPPASTLEKKIRRAERFGVPVQLSEEEKRNSRAERFGTALPSAAKDVVVSEEQKRKARAERFGLAGDSSADEDAKKKARLERFSQDPKPNSVEEEKRKARAARFSGKSDASSEKKTMKRQKEAPKRRKASAVRRLCWPANHMVSLSQLQLLGDVSF